MQQSIANDTLHYSFVLHADGEVAVFLESVQGTVQLEMIDSLTQQTLVVMYALTGLGYVSNELRIVARQVYLLRLTPGFVDTAATFRFKVSRVNRAPELVPARFTWGDTVTGESLATVADIDEFLVAGLAGQEIVVVGEGLGPLGSGAFLLSVQDPGDSVVGTGYHTAGIAAPQASGRFALPVSGDYRFGFRSDRWFGYPPYLGPYRFWTYVIDRAPERLPVVPPLGSVITGEVIDQVGDIDEFTLSAAVGAEFNVFLQASRSAQLHVVTGSGTPLAGAATQVGDTGLFQRATGLFGIPAGGTVVLRFSAQTSGLVSDTGSYLFFVDPVDRRPEHRPAAIADGDTVLGEAIDRPGDVDEFTFSGTPGEEFNVAFQTLNASPAVALKLEVVNDAGVVVRSVASVGSDTGLFQHVTGRFFVSSGGVHRLRVRGALDITDRDVGAYRFFFFRILRSPEILPAALIFGDSLSGEAIDLPGDVDEFRVVVLDTSGTHLLVQQGDEPTGQGLSVEVIDSTTGESFFGVTTPGAGAYGSSGTRRLGPGTYTVRVQGSRDEDRLLSYRLWLFRFSDRPEIVGDTIAIGDTVVGESINPPGDHDAFVFFGVQGQHINVAFEGLGVAQPAGNLGATIAAPSAIPGLFPLTFLYGPTVTDSVGPRRSNRMDLVATGWYQIDVASAASPGAALADRGPYRLAVRALGVAPEVAPDTLVPGDSVTSEVIEYPGDWDEYTLTAPPGQEVAILGRRLSGGRFPQIAVFDSVANDARVSILLQDFDRLTRGFSMPSSGRVRLGVYEYRGYLPTCFDSTCGNLFEYVGGYHLTMFAINRSPESAPGTFLLGDTVRGESLSPVADVDEFDGTGIPGDTVSAWFRLLQAPAPAGSFINIAIIDPATGTPLSSTLVGLINGSANEPFVPVWTFPVPLGGAYRIRVFSGGFDGDKPGVAPYEFFTKLGP